MLIADQQSRRYVVRWVATLPSHHGVGSFPRSMSSLHAQEALIHWLVYHGLGEIVTGSVAEAVAGSTP